MSQSNANDVSGHYEIEELKRIERALRQTERTLTTLISNLPGFVYRCANDPKWTMKYISEGCTKVTGYEPRDFINNHTLSFSEIIHPHYRNWSRWQETLRSGGYLEDEYPIYTASGETRWVWERGHGVNDENGKLRYIEGFITDITERKLAENELANREAQYRHLFELSPVAILVEDMAGNILEVNDAYCLSSGYKREELIGQNIRMFVPPENLHLVDTHFAALNAGATLEHEVFSLGRSGERRIKLLRERAVPLPNGQQGILSLATDITEQKQAEQSLQQSEKKYRSLIEHMLEGMAIIDFTGQILLWNPAGLKIFGIGPSDLSTLPQVSAFDFVHPSFADKCRDEMKLLSNGVDLTSHYRFLRLNGEVGWMDVHATKIDYAGTEAILILMRDITERKLEEEFREYMSWHDALTNLYNRRYFEKVMSENNLSSPGIIVADLDGLKLINDTLGHDRGDSLLRVAAEMLKQCTPANGITARIGGDEFVVIAPDSTAQSIETLMQSIKQLQEDYNQRHPELPLSLSLGYGLAGCYTATLYDLFREADNYMYRRKLFHQRSSRSSLIHALMGALETKNLETREHVDRVGELALRLARRIGYPESKLMELDLFTKFHDIGKVGIANSILNKPGPLTAEERAEMQRHAEIGYRIASASPELGPISELILKHHEWYNGRGYPLEIRGEQIPIECRIVSIVDAYDAMTSDRPYRQALTKDAAIAELERCAGSQFDPWLVDIFIEMVK